MSVFDRLNFDFDTTKFNGADTLSSGASNTLTLIANTTGTFSTWQKEDLAAGPVVRTDYFQNPLASNITTLLVLTNSILSTADTCNTENIQASAQSLIISLNSFSRHTGNISGINTVANTTYPSLSSAQSMGQLNMMTLAKTDGVSNTTPILGSFTSLFIGPELTANIATLTTYDSLYANSIITVDGVDGEGAPTTSYSSNLSSSMLSDISSYLDSTSTMLNTRVSSDINFYRNSTQVSKDAAFLQQFDNMGGTMSFLVNNYVGTPSLLDKMNNS